MSVSCHRWSDISAISHLGFQGLSPNGVKILAGLLGRARSPRGDAEAAVDGRGALVSLRLAESVARMPPEALGALIVDTAHAAARDAMARRAHLLDDLVDELGG